VSRDGAKLSGSISNRGFETCFLAIGLARFSSKAYNKSDPFILGSAPTGHCLRSATELIAAGGIEALAVCLIDHPDTGDVIPGSGGVRKLRWAAKGEESRRRRDRPPVGCDCCPFLPDSDPSGSSGPGAIGATLSANAGSGAPSGTLTTPRDGSLVVGVGEDPDQRCFANDRVFAEPSLSGSHHDQ
jgi:hypothetical protein